MLMACLAFAAGIFWARYVWGPPSWLLAGAAVCVTATALLLVRRSWRCAVLSLVVLFFLLGGLAWQGHTSQHPSFRLRDYADNQELGLTGVVLNDASISRGMFGGVKQNFDLSVESIQSEGQVEQVNGIARLSLYSKAAAENDDIEEKPASTGSSPALRAGERVGLRAKLSTPANYGNPGAFDYRHYLERQGILVTGGGKLESLTRVNQNALPVWERWRSKSRRVMVNLIHSTWPAEQAAILDAMLIGDASSIGRETRTDFQRSGTYHILVVSGFNVVILAFVTFWVLHKLPISDVVVSIVTVLLSLGYTYLTGAGPPVVRATAMLAIYLITRLLYRDRAALNAVCTTALLLLVYDPESLFDPSFQLTFLSVLAIAGIVLPIVEITSGPYHRALAQLSSVGYDNSLEPRLAQFRLDLRLLVSRLGRLLGRRLAYRAVGSLAALGLGFYETILVSTIIQLALALPMAWYFHRATLTALLTNVVVVPVTALMLPIAIAALLCTSISHVLAIPFQVVTGTLLDFVDATVRYFGKMRASDLRIPTPGPEIALIATAGVAVAIFSFRQKHRVVRFAGVTALVVTSLMVFTVHSRVQASAPLTLQVVSIDVGQGDSFLIVTPEGKSLLLDSGGILNGDHANFDIGEDVVSPFLWNYGISRLDAVAVSHTHVDHAGGMVAVIHNFKPRELWIPPGAEVHERKRLLEAASIEGTTLRVKTAPEYFEWGGASFQILGPPPDVSFGPKVNDNNALVLRISFQGRSALFCGDIGKTGEQRVIPQNPHADLLKIAHHGSANATSAEFLQAVHPTYAIISVGRRNVFGHPRPQTLQKLAAAHVQTYRTDLFGATRFDLDRSGVRVTPLALIPPRGLVLPRYYETPR